jgi:anti-anti-sigma factor
MEITLSVAGEIPVFHLKGRLDVSTSPLLEERLKPLLSVQGQKVIFDCDELTYVSSAGLRVFIATLRHLAAQEGGVSFAKLTPSVRELFHLAGLDNLFIIESSVEEAAARLQ